MNITYATIFEVMLRSKPVNEKDPTYLYENLHVIAGPRGCGKSALFENPQKYLVPSLVPEPAKRLIETPPPIDIKAADLEQAIEAKTGERWVHTDIFYPLGGEPRTLPAIYEQLTPALYRDWSATASFARARELHVFTLFTPRAELFRRWISRQIDAGYTSVGIKVATIFGLDTDQEKPFWLLYRAWLDFVDSLPCTSKTIIDTTTIPYTFIEQAEWRAGIDSPYIK